MKILISILVFFLLCGISWAIPPSPPSSGTQAIDDTKGNGDTTYVWSADKVFDQFALKLDASRFSFAGSNNVLTYPGDYTPGFILTGNTSLTFPTSGTLATTASNISGTAANLSGTPAVPNGTTATTQAAADKTSKLATTAYVDTPTTQSVSTSDSGADSDKAAQTVTPTANVQRLTILRTCSDDDGCTDTLAETGAVDGALVTIVNIGTYTSDYATSAGVLNLKNGTPFAMAAGESLTIVYANSQWNEVTRSSATFGPLSAFVLPYGTDSAPTAEGSLYHNSSTDVTTIGDGSAANALAKIAKDNSWSGANTIGDGGDDQRLVMRINATNERWSGNTLYFAQCAASLAFGTPVYIQSTGKPAAADADAAATMPAIGLIVVASTDADTPCTVLTHGTITDTDWNFTTVGATIYASETAGSVELDVANISDTNDVVQVLGIALHADTLFVNPSLVTIVLE
jgi:hypothetical protein